MSAALLRQQMLARLLRGEKPDLGGKPFNERDDSAGYDPVQVVAARLKPVELDQAKPVSGGPHTQPTVLRRVKIPEELQ